MLRRRVADNLQRKFTALWLRQRFNTGQSRRDMAAYARLLCPHVVGYNEPGEWRVFCYQYGGETKSGPLPSGDEGIWRCLSLRKLSSVELLDSPWRTEPHARQRCVENIEIDADDYPGGDPQNGQ